jgi:hypothetical protein
MTELLFENFQDKQLFELSNITSNITWSTYKNGTPAKLELQIIKGYNTKILFKAGSVIAFKIDGKGLFYGYLFNVSTTKEQINLTFYDQLRYLNATGTYKFSGATAGDVIRTLALDFNLKVGVIDNPPRIIRPLIQDNKKILDIILTALDDVLINQKEQYTFYDDYGLLTLRNVKDLAIGIVIGDGSLATSFTHEASIDNSFNFIKLIKDNKDKGERFAYIVKDSNTMHNWGKLQMFEVVDDKMTSSEIAEKAKLLLELHNKVKQQLDINAIGNVTFRGGRSCFVDFTETGQSGWFVIEECKHSFKGTQHEMNLKMKVV